MRSLTHQALLFVGLNLALAPLLAQSTIQSAAQPALQADEPADDQVEKVAAEKFLALLLKRPSTGTALDRVLSYHIQQGSIDRLIQELTDQATQAGDQQAGHTWFVVGLLQLQRSEDAQAVLSLSKASELLPSNALCAFHYGQALLLVGDTERAVTAFRSAIDRRPAKSDYLNIARELGKLYQRMGRAEDALQIWNQLETAFPNDEAVRQRIASALVEEGDLAGGLKRYEELARTAKSESDRLNAALEVSNLHGQLGHKSQALEQLQQVLNQLRPGSYLYEETWRRIERHYLSSGDYPGLTDYYRAWLTKQPHDLPAQMRLARVLSLQGQSDQAIEQLLAALKLAPTDVALRQVLIDAYVAARRFREAAAQYEVLLAGDNQHPDYLVKYGRILLSDSQLPEAERQQAAAAVWKRLLTLRPGQAETNSQVADLLREARLTDEAIHYYRQAIDLSPEEPKYREYLGEYLHQLKRTDEALTVWRSLAVGELRTLDNLVYLAEILYQFDQQAEALKVMQEACEHQPRISHRLRYIQWLQQSQQYALAEQQIQLARAEADNAEDQAKVLAAAVETYKLARQLPEKITQLRTAVEASPGDINLWRELAMLYDAANQPYEAWRSIERCVAINSQSVEILDLAARLSQKAGQLAGAIDIRQRLVAADPRFRSAHLQSLAELYATTGQNAVALQTSQEMLVSSGGSLEGFRAHIDLCERLGERQKKADALRHCWQRHPRNELALTWLASHLADEFKTEQAIELFWKLLETTGTDAGRRQAVERLTDLYLRSNRLDQLISRLEIRGREQNDRLVTAELISAAYRAAGDLGLARQTLELAMQDSEPSLELIQQFISLCQQSGDLDRAIEMQREFLRQVPDSDSWQMLASLLTQAGQIDEAEEIWLANLNIRGSSAELLRQMEQLGKLGETERANALAAAWLERQPQAWEVRTCRMLLNAADEDWEAAADDAHALLSLNLPSSTPTSDPRHGPTHRLLYRRGDHIFRLYAAMDVERMLSSGLQEGILRPDDYGCARSYAHFILFKQAVVEGESREQAIFKELEQRALAADATADTVCEWLTARFILSNLQVVPSTDIYEPASWDSMWRLFDVDPEIGWEMILNRLRARCQDYLQVARNPSGEETSQELARFKPIPPERLHQIAMFAQKATATPATAETDPTPGLIIYATELRIAGQIEQARQVMDQFRENIRRPEQALANLDYFATHEPDDQLWSIVQLALGAETQVRRNWLVNGYELLDVFSQSDRVLQRLSKGYADPVYVERILELLEQSLRLTSQSQLTAPAIYLGSLESRRMLYIGTPADSPWQYIDFPPAGLGQEDELLAVAYQVFQHAPQATDAFATRLTDKAGGQEPRLAVEYLQVAASIRFWQQQVDQSITALQQAVEIAARESLPTEMMLRLLLVDLYLRTDKKPAALSVMESLVTRNQQDMTLREFALARLAESLGQRERAEQAVRRLLTVRLDVDAQAELANLMQRLNMQDLAHESMRRLRARAGNSLAQLQTTLDYFVAQNHSEQALEVATEILRRTTSRTRNSRTRSSYYRAQAFDVLRQSGKLTEWIATLETRYRHAPKSSRVAAELIEAYEAADLGDKADAIRTELQSIDTGKARSPQQLLSTAVRLGSNRREAEACDVWLELLARKPRSFNDENINRIIFDFAQAKRTSQLFERLMEAGVENIASSVLINVCNRWKTDEQTNEQAYQLLLAVLQLRKNIDPYMLNGFLDVHVSWFDRQEFLDRLTDVLLEHSRKVQPQWSEMLRSGQVQREAACVNLLTRCITASAKSGSDLSWLEQKIRLRLEQQPGWIEGQIALALVLTTQNRFAQAQELLEPLAEATFEPKVDWEVLWIVGSHIDVHPPMQPLAMQLYQRAQVVYLESGVSGFRLKETFIQRATHLALALRRPEEARRFLVEILDQFVSTYAYEKSSHWTSSEHENLESLADALDFLVENGFPEDATRLLSRLDLPASSANADDNRLTQFQVRVEAIRDGVRTRGEEALLKTLLRWPTTESSDIEQVVDLAVYCDALAPHIPRIRSVWLEVFQQAESLPDGSQRLVSLREQLESLRTARPKDYSVAVAHAIAVSQPESYDELLKCLQQPSAALALEDKQKRSVYLAQAAAFLRWQELHFRRSSPVDVLPLLAWLKQHSVSWDAWLRTGVYGELVRHCLQQSDHDALEKVWREFSALPDQSIELYLKWAHLAVELGSPQVAQWCASHAAGIWRDQLKDSQEPETLGALLGNERENEFEPVEYAMLEGLIELDKQWTRRGFDPALAYTWLTDWQIGDHVMLQPLMTQSLNEPQRLYRSVFDLLARRAQAIGQTEQLITGVQSVASNPRWPPGNLSHKALIAIALFRGGQPQPGLQVLKSIEARAMEGLPIKVMAHAIEIGLEDVANRADMLAFALDYLGTIEPKLSEQSSEVRPLARLVRQLASQGQFVPELKERSITIERIVNKYETGQHYYLESQWQAANEEMARTFIEQGDVARALECLLVRDGLLDDSESSSSDPLSAYLLKRLASYHDLRDAYQRLSQWTLPGEGGLRVLAAIYVAEPTPAWETGAPLESELVSNVRLLALMAQQLGLADELLGRFGKALEDQRPDAAMAMATILATWGRPLPDDLVTQVIEAIKQMVDKPGAGLCCRRPLLLLQLAKSLVAQNRQDAAWQRIEPELARLEFLEEQSFLNPWFRECLAHGQSRSIQSPGEESLQLDFIRTLPLESNSLNSGSKPANWTVVGDDSFQVIGGSEQEILYMRQPLQGNFVFEFESQWHPYSTVILVAGGIRFWTVGEAPRHFYIESLDASDHVAVLIPKPKDEWLKHRLVAEDQTLSYYVDDLLIYHEPRSPQPLWLGFGTSQYHDVSIRGIKLGGQPAIAKAVDLLQADTLRGWFSPMYYSPIPSSRLSRPPTDSVASEVSYQEGTNKIQLPSLAWSVKNGELVSGTEISGGPGEQSVLHYHRPLLPQESVEYEFYYEPGKFEAHPSLGRTVFLLDPSGIQFHWLTDLMSDFGLPADNRVIAKSSQPLPLLANQWNKLVLELGQDKVVISVNGQPVLESFIDCTRRDSRFGLFHYRDQSQVRVRNLRHTLP